MLTRLRFKNWRSLRDVEIADLTPLTVFIGANASGKTNIVDALAFLRRLLTERSRDAVFFAENVRPIRTVGVTDEPIEIEVEYKSPPQHTNIAYSLTIDPQELSQMDEMFFERIDDELKLVGRGKTGMGRFKSGFFVEGDGVGNLFLQMLTIPFERITTGEFPFEFRTLAQFLSPHSQFLNESASAPERSPITPSTDYLNIDQDGSNTLDVLNFMQQNHPAVFAELMNDFRWLLAHVEDASITFDGRETRLTVKERPLSGQTAPTVSGGTLRLLAMLTAYYALDMQLPELPGLVVIEEPDTGLNPGLLKRFVEQLREYTRRTDRPRQFILTTHNPAFLDYFQPEEVRVVSRDDKGETHVERVPDSIKEIWLDEYGLGEVWKTRAFGGLPE